MLVLVRFLLDIVGETVRTQGRLLMKSNYYVAPCTNMPHRRRRKKRRRPKRRTRRSKNRSFKRYRNPVATNGFPSRYAARLKYTSFITLDMASISSGVGVQHRFRANSLYAPEYDAVGHQPRGFDELASIWDHYCVIGSKMRVTFNSDVDTLANVGMYAFANLQDTANSIPSLISMCEDRKSNCRYMSRSTVSSHPVTLTESYSPYKMFGIPKKDSLISNSRLNTQCQSNPLEDAIYAVGVVCERTTTTDPNPIVARVDISFMCIFTELRPIRQS